MFELRETYEFSDWLESLRDRRAKIRIGQRLDKFKRGLIGDAKSVSGGVSELRIDVGPGYRVYFTRGFES